MADYSFSQLEGLWIQAGGSRALAPVMAAIALAESGGNPNATGPVGERGLWQIYPGAWGSLATYDPLGNAKAAVYVLAHQGLGAWTTYSSGAYKRYLPSGQVAPATTAELTSQLSPFPGVLTDPFQVIDALGKTIGQLFGGGVSLATSVQGIAQGITSLSKILYTMLNDALWLFKPSNWIRIFCFVLGIGALLPGIWMLSKAGKGEGDISLALGILLTMAGGVLLFVAFHALPDTIKSLQDLLGYISSEVRKNSPATTG